MKKRSFMITALASVTVALAMPLAVSTPASPITYAKSTKKVAGKTVAKAIRSTPDLNPLQVFANFPLQFMTSIGKSSTVGIMSSR